MFDPDIAPAGPALQCRTDVLRTVIASNDLLRAANGAPGRQREIDIDAKGFPDEIVDHVERPDTPAVALNWSCMKSIDQTWLIDADTVSTAGFSRTMRFFGLMRRYSSSDR